MLAAIIILSIVTIVGWTMFLLNRKKTKHLVNTVSELQMVYVQHQSLMKQQEQHIDSMIIGIERYKQSSELWRQIAQRNLVEFAKIFEVPKPASAYQSIYRPSQDGKSLNMLWLCMETGNVVRWRFPNADSIRREAKRMSNIADIFEAGELEEESLLISMPIGIDTMIH